MAAPTRGGTVVVAVIRRGDSILMVRHDDPEPLWSLPAGRAEPGELMHAAMAREVREETGLQIVDCGRLGWASQTLLDDEQSGAISTVLAFEASDGGDEPRSADPDGLVQEARFVTVQEAQTLLEQHPSRIMTEPALAFLRRRAGYGSWWVWRAARGFADEELIAAHLAPC